MTAPCGCVCAPRSTLASCPYVYPSLVNPGQNDKALPDYAFGSYYVSSGVFGNAPNVWIITGVGNGQSVTSIGGDIWESGLVSTAGGSIVFYDRLEITGMGAGEVTLTRIYTTHSGPNPPGNIHYENIEPLLRSGASGTGLFRLVLDFCDMSNPVASESMRPYLPWIGRGIPCRISYTSS